MTIGLSYNDDISRIQVSVTGLPFSTGTIRIERSTNGLYWETVRGAAELPVSGGAAAVDDFEFSADVENTYRVVPIDPVAGLHLPGTAGSYASTPDHPDLRITGDVVLTSVARLATWVGAAGTQMLVSRYDAAADERSYQLSLLSSGSLRVSSSPNGVTAINMSSAEPVDAADDDPLGVRAWLDVDLGGAGTDRRAIFLTSPDGADGTWTQLGGVVDAAGATSIHPGTSELRVGVSPDGFGPVEGVVYRAHVWDGGMSGGDLASGSTVADPDFTDQAMGATSFTDDAGRVWTIHGDAYLVGTETASITPSLDGLAWIKSIRHPFLNRPIHRVLAGGGQEIGRAARDGVFQVQGRSVPIVVSDVRSSRGFNLTVQVADEAAARDMDLILASGDVFFIHVPPELTEHMSGGYVRIGDTVQHRVADTIKWRFELPCTVVAKPGPGVVGGTMTYGALLNLYGGYQNVLAANSTYADVLALMASPEDLVVLP